MYHQTTMLLKKTPFRIIYAIIVISLFGACSTGSKFASSFGKRKYIKGYYLDVPSSTPKVSELPGVKKLIESPVIAGNSNLFEKKISNLEPARFVKTFLQQTFAKTAKHNSAITKPITSIEKAPSITNIVLSIQGDGGRHTGDNATTTTGKLSKASLIAFLIFIVFVLIAIILAAATGSLAYLWILGLSYLIDLVAVILAIIALIQNEEGKNLAIIVLVLNGLLIAFFVLAPYLHL